MDAGIAAKLLAGLPLMALLAVDFLLLWFPDVFGDDDNPSEGPAFWKPRPGGWTINPAHPAAKQVFRFWMALGLVWLGALDEVIRHDFSNLFRGLFG